MRFSLANRILFGFGLLAVAAGAGAGVFVLRDHLYRGEALPGVHVRAAQLLAPVSISAAGQRFSLEPGTVIRENTRATHGEAVAAGRDSFLHRAFALLSPVPPTRSVDPVLRTRPLGASKLFARLDKLGRPSASASASVTLSGVDPVVHPARFGTRVDQQAFLAALDRHVLTGHSTIAVRYRNTRPTISTAEADRAAAAARIALSAPIELRYDGRSVGSLAPLQLAPFLRLQSHGSRLVPALAADGIANVVRPSLDPWRRGATNARFVVDGSRVRIEPSSLGYDVDPAVAASAVLTASSSETGRFADLALRAIPADMTTEKAQQLGIRQQLVSFTTQMGDSSSNRIHNVHLMADFIDGTLIKPGETFSFNDVVGPRTAERGFLEGQQIIGSLVLPSIGGGVCQTATTLFNDAFETGLPVLSRTNHNLYLSHYPLGRDATVSWGGPDLVFRNDLAHGILIKSSYTDSTLTFTFYGTPQGRRIVSTTGPETNSRTPSMSYAIDPNAPRGSVHVVAGSGRSGFSISVTRTVYERGKVLRNDTFYSTYIPEGPTRVYGPGATPPGPYLVLPSVS
ncbi:MAG: VanW family protein [Gaiellaceae bacterium]